MNLPRTVGVFALITLIVAATVAAMFLRDSQNRRAVLQSELGERGLHIFRSFRKIPDALFIPLLMFHKSELPQYDIFISDKNLEKLNSRLPDEPLLGMMEEDSKVWVSAQFRSGDYNDQVKIRYRGNLANHWNSFKKSYSIKFPKDNLFQGMREISIVIPLDRSYFAASLNNYRAKKMGLLTQDEYYSNVSLNGADLGVYLTAEHWSQEFLEKRPVSALSSLYGLDEHEYSFVYDSPFSAYTDAALPIWKSWNSDRATSSELMALFELTEHASDEEFERLIPSLVDLEAVYAVDTLRTLAGIFHVYDDGQNIVLMFDATEGRFKPIPYNVNLSVVDTGRSIIDPPLLQERILNNPTFKAERDAYFAAYVEEHSADDIAFVDQWIETYKNDFLKDNGKRENNFGFLATLKENRDAVVAFTKLTPSDFEQNYTIASGTGESLSFPPEFRYLEDTAVSPAVFVRKYPQFWLSDDTIILSTGRHYFNETIIVPRDTKLVVSSGAHLFMGPNVSIVSFSPVEFHGTEYAPVVVEGAVSDEPWGVVAMMNTEEISSFTHTTFKGGSEMKMNGVWLSGMVAAHNADVTIASSTFTDVRGEDGLNIKGGYVSLTGSTFARTFSDGLDLDYVESDSVIENNLFTNIGGDAIDISWNTAPIVSNTVTNCIDKGISVGERSQVVLEDNTIEGCDMGVAVKDQSEATLIGNTFINNRLGVTAYQKKPFFGGGMALLIDNTLTDNITDTKVDGVSTITFSDAE